MKGKGDFMSVPKKDYKKTKISDIEKVMQDPNFLAAARKMHPDLAKMSDEDFKKVAAGVSNRLDIFKGKFGDMTTEQVLDLGEQQNAMKSEPAKMVSDVKTGSLMSSLKAMPEQDRLSLSEHLNGGHSLIVGDVIRQTEKKYLFFKRMEDVVGIKYIFRVEGNQLRVYTMKDATEQELILTLAYVIKMKPNAFNMLYDQYITKNNRYYTCDEDLLDRAHYRVCIDNTFKDMDESTDTFIERQFSENPDGLFVFENVPEVK